MGTTRGKATTTKKQRSRSGHAAGRSRPRGSIDRLDSGSLRVRVDAGADPITGKRHRPTVIVAPGPDDEHQAEVALTRLLNEVDDSGTRRRRSTSPTWCSSTRANARLRAPRSKKTVA
jgi:hypothetical protein